MNIRTTTTRTSAEAFADLANLPPAPHKPTLPESHEGWLLGESFPDNTPIVQRLKELYELQERQNAITDRQDMLPSDAAHGEKFALRAAYDNLLDLEHAQMKAAAMTPLYGREDMVALVAHLIQMADHIPSGDDQYPTADAALKSIHLGLDTLASYLIANGADQMPLPQESHRLLQQADQRDQWING